MKDSNLLLIEDDKELAEGLCDALRSEGYQVEAAYEGPQGLEKALSGRAELIVLDVMLPGLSGFDILKKLREEDQETLVLMLTARGQEVDKVRGLRLGADDYLAKPFGLMELMARLEALLRRRKPSREEAEAPRRLTRGHLTVDFGARQAVRRGRTHKLTNREVEILEVLVGQMGLPVAREDLIAAIWGISDDVEVTTRTIDQHIASLRRKLEEDPSEPELIETVYGYGYRFRQ